MMDSQPPTLGMPRDEFLAQVRRSLDRPGPAAPEKPYHRLTESLAALERQAAERAEQLRQERPALLERFAETAQLRGWQLCSVADPEEAIGYITALAAEREVAQAARSAEEVFDLLPLDAALENQGISTAIIAWEETKSRAALREQIIQSGMGLTGADYAVAETGSIVIIPRRGLSRLVSLVPPIHIALVRPPDLVATLDDVFLFRRLEYYRNGGAPDRYLNFITGPSRTADIEQRLVVGVHGPKEVHLILLGGPA